MTFWGLHSNTLKTLKITRKKVDHLRFCVLWMRKSEKNILVFLVFCVSFHFHLIYGLWPPQVKNSMLIPSGFIEVPRFFVPPSSLLSFLSVCYALPLSHTPSPLSPLPLWSLKVPSLYRSSTDRRESTTRGSGKVRYQPIAIVSVCQKELSLFPCRIFYMKRLSFIQRFSLFVLDVYPFTFLLCPFYYVVLIHPWCVIFTLIRCHWAPIRTHLET